MIYLNIYRNLINHRYLIIRNHHFPKSQQIWGFILMYDSFSYSQRQVSIDGSVCIVWCKLWIRESPPFPLWEQVFGFDLNFVMTYRGILNDNNTGPCHFKSNDFLSKRPNHKLIAISCDVTRYLSLQTSHWCRQVQENCGPHHSPGDDWVSCHPIEVDSLVW